MENTPKRLEWIDEILSIEIISLINEYLMLYKDISEIESLFKNSKWPKVPHKPRLSRFPSAFEQLLKDNANNYPEEIVNSFTSIIIKLRLLKGKIKDFDFNKKEQIYWFFEKQLEIEQQELWLILPDNFRKIFLIAAWLGFFYFPRKIMEEAKKAIERAMRR